MSIYDRNGYNLKQLQIDSLPIRRTAHKNVMYYDKPQRNNKRCKICVDAFDNAKILRTMENKYSPNEQVTYYYLDVASGIVRKLKEYTRYANKHNLSIDSNLVYKGRKSVAIRKLNKLLENA